MGILLIVAFVIGVAVGVAAAMFIYGTGRARLEEQLRAAQTTATDLQGRLAQQAIESSERGLENVRLKEQLAGAKAITAKQEEAFEKAEKVLADKFAAMAREALHGNSEQFILLAQAKLSEKTAEGAHELDAKKTAVEHLVTPIATALEKMNHEVQELASISKALRSDQQELRLQTGRLVSALKTPIHRGRWGEEQLKRIAEMAGMLKHCDFDEQVTFKGDDADLRPDMVVNLAGGRQIVVDAKAPIQAYMEALEIEDDSLRAEKLKIHAKQVKERIAKLSSKAYWNQLPYSPDLVVAFVPGECFFSAALQADATLLEFGTDSRVLLASPISLIALLKAAAYGWQQQDLQQNAEHIRELGQSLYDRIGTLFKHISKLRGAIDSSVEHFNGMLGSLETNVITGARKFKELSAAKGDDYIEVKYVERHVREIEGTKIEALGSGMEEGAEQEVMPFHGAIAAKAGGDE